MLETFFDLDELVIAVEAVRGVSSLPIVALLTFENDAETLAGVGARDAADKLRELGVSALGANHGAGLQAALRRSSRWAATASRSPRCRTSASRAWPAAA